MHQQPAQAAQRPVPGPSQHGLHPCPPISQPPSVPSRFRPYPPGLNMHPYQQVASAAHPVYGAPYPVPPAHHWGGYPPASEGVGVPLAPAQPSYPSAPPLVQSSYNQHPEQGLGQQAPVAAAEESAVKRGKRKAVDPDDAPPRKKQAIQAPVDDFDFDMVQINGELRYRCCMPQCKNVPAVQCAGIEGHIKSKQHQNGWDQFASPDSDKAASREVSSNISGSSSKNKEAAVAQGPCEGSSSNTPLLEVFSDSLEDYDWTSSELFEEPVNGLDEPTELAGAEQVKNPVNSLDQITVLAWTEKVKEFFDILQESADSASDKLPEGLTKSDGKTIDLTSDEQLQECINGFNETGDSESDDLSDFYMKSIMEAQESALQGKLLRKLLEHWFP